MTYLEIENSIRNAKQLDFGDLISDVVELFKKVWLKGFITVLLILASSLCVIFVFTIIGLSPQNVSIQQPFDLQTFTSNYFSSILFSIPQSIIISTFTLAFLSAFYRICKQTVLNEVENDDYFYFFNKAYFSKVFMLGIIYSGIAVLAQLMFVIPYFYAFVPLSFFAVIMANNPDMTDLEIVKLSFKLGNKKWLITFITIFIAAILGMLGVLACGIGILLTLSVVYLPSFLVYKEVVGFNKTNNKNIMTNPETENESNFNR